MFKKPETNNSPKNVNSALYPDGIMSPLWIQKVKSNPGVVLGIYDLVFVKSKNDPLGVAAADTYRESDAAICSILNEKRKSLPVERGRKFIPVFILTGYTVDIATNLEERIAFMRKSCGSEKIFTIDLNSMVDEEELKKFMKGYALIYLFQFEQVFTRFIIFLLQRM